jgi:HK97 gp10 family phage protein
MSGFKVSGTIKGVANIPKKFKKFQQEVMAYQIRAMQSATLKIHETAVKSIQENADGTPQVRYDPKRTVNVSAPGDPPNTDTGRLVQSIQMNFLNDGLTGQVGTNLLYGKYLEFGTTKMRARPWLAPAVAQVTEDLKDIFKKAFNEVIHGAGE